jgi:hypothetical protein
MPVTDVFQVLPVNHPTIMGVALCHKKFVLMVYNKIYCNQHKINHISCHAQAHILHTSENSNSCAENKLRVHERKIFR